MITTRTKYGIKALLVLAREYSRNKIVTIPAIAQAERIPLKYLESILLDLKNAGLLSSKRGPGGGYLLAHDPRAISLAQVIRELDGPIAPIRCVSAKASYTCDECQDPRTCSLRMVMQKVRDSMVLVLQNISLDDMVRLSDQAAMEIDQVLGSSLA